MSEVQKELIASRDNLRANLERSRKMVAEWTLAVEDQSQRLSDYDTAIAALEPAPYDPSALAHEEHIADHLPIEAVRPESICSVANCNIHSTELAASDSTLGSSLRPFDDPHQDEDSGNPLPGGEQESPDILNDPDLKASVERAEARLDFNDTFRPRKMQGAE